MDVARTLGCLLELALSGHEGPSSSLDNGFQQSRHAHWHVQVVLKCSGYYHQHDRHARPLVRALERPAHDIFFQNIFRIIHFDGIIDTNFSAHLLTAPTLIALNC